MGNCIALRTSKLVSTQVHGDLNEQPLHPVGDDERYGRDGQKCKYTSRSRSSESKEAEDFSSAKPAVSCKNVGGGVVRIKLLIRKQDLAELLSNDLAKRAAKEDLLVELQAKLGDHSTAVYYPYEGSCDTVTQKNSHSGWRPSLESIPEDKKTYLIGIPE